jgi:hypothetical protein
MISRQFLSPFLFTAPFFVGDKIEIMAWQLAQSIYRSHICVSVFMQLPLVEPTSKETASELPVHFSECFVSFQV